MNSIETLLALIYADGNGSGGGGGGGTTNYNMLSNRPKINGHVLEGDQTGAALGLTGMKVFELDVVGYDESFVYQYDGEYKDICDAIYAGDMVVVQLNRYGDGNPKEWLIPKSMELDYEPEEAEFKYYNVTVTNKFTRLKSRTGTWEDEMTVQPVGWTIKLTSDNVEIEDRPQYYNLESVLKANVAARIKSESITQPGETERYAFNVYGQTDEYNRQGPKISIYPTETVYDSETYENKMVGMIVDVSDDQAEFYAKAEIYTKEFVDTMIQRIAALEAKLADYEETRLQMTDGTNTVDKIVLAKPYAAPTP